MAADPKLLKICLTNKGADSETPWAQELGPASNAPPGSLRVKLVNVPFMHAKPTWGDVIVVSPKAGTYPTWDRDGVPWKQIDKRILEDGGRWAMIVDYLIPPGTLNHEAFAALGRACEASKIVCEGAWGARDQEPGRAYLAVQRELKAEAVMTILATFDLPLQLIQIHPEPKKDALPTPPPRAQTQPGISDAAGRAPSKPRPRPEVVIPVATPLTTSPPAPAPTPPPKRAVVKPAGAANASSVLKKATKAATKAAAKAAAAPPPKLKPPKAAPKPVAAKAKPAAKPVAKAKPAPKSAPAKKPAKKK